MKEKSMQLWISIHQIDEIWNLGGLLILRRRGIFPRDNSGEMNQKREKIIHVLFGQNPQTQLSQELGSRERKQKSY